MLKCALFSLHTHAQVSCCLVFYNLLCASLALPPGVHQERWWQVYKHHQQVGFVSCLPVARVVSSQAPPQFLFVLQATKAGDEAIALVASFPGPVPTFVTASNKSWERGYSSSSLVPRPRPNFCYCKQQKLGTRL